MQTFYYGLTQKSCEQLDATAEGSFMSLTPRRAEAIVAKMKENQKIRIRHSTLRYAMKAKKFQKSCVRYQPRWMYY